jgi:hypothetical protein
MADPLEADRRAAEKRRKAHRAANRLLVGAGIILAEAGVPLFAPQMKALSAALRAVNRAGELLTTRSAGSVDQSMSPARSISEAQRLRRAAP